MYVHIDLGLQVRRSIGRRGSEMMHTLRTLAFLPRVRATILPLLRTRAMAVYAV